MNPTRLAACLAAAIAVLAFPAAAEDWDDQACQIAAGATRLDAAKAIRIGEGLGYSIADYEIDDGCIELEGTDSQGARVTLRLDPVSGAVIPYRR
jgi:hypothetical protein